MEKIFNLVKYNIGHIIKTTRGKLYRPNVSRATTRINILDGQMVVVVHCTASRKIGNQPRCVFHVNGRLTAASKVSELIADHNSTVDKIKYGIVNPHPNKNNPDCDDVWFGDVDGKLE